LIQSSNLFKGVTPVRSNVRVTNVNSVVLGGTLSMTACDEIDYLRGERHILQKLQCAGATTPWMMDKHVSTNIRDYIRGENSASSDIKAYDLVGIVTAARVPDFIGSHHVSEKALRSNSSSLKTVCVKAERDSIVSGCPLEVDAEIIPESSPARVNYESAVERSCPVKTTNDLIQHVIQAIVRTREQHLLGHV